jgi:hypothetical protein
MERLARRFNVPALLSAGEIVSAKLSTAREYFDRHGRSAD